MSAKTQHNNILLAVLGFTLVVAVVALIGALTLRGDDETIEGEVEVTEYRVSSKLPGRIVELRVKEGDYVRVGDTLAILEVPEVDAQKRVAEATSEATHAAEELTDAGARREQVQRNYQMTVQAQSAADIAHKTYTRMQNLYDEGVVSGQKRDEALAAWKVAEAQAKAAKSQYELTLSGARKEERRLAAKNTQAARSAVDVVSSLLRETVQVSAVEGEVSDVYPHVGELVGLGSPIMSIAVMKDLWGTFNVREDQLEGMNMGQTFKAMVPAFRKDGKDREIAMKVYYVKDQGSYAVWKATKATGQYDLKTFEVKARPVGKAEGLRPGMSLVVRRARP